MFFLENHMQNVMEKLVPDFYKKVKIKHIPGSEML